jgi:histidine ammonia-lyase
LEHLVELDGSSLTVDRVVQVARHFAKVIVTQDAIERVTLGRKSIERIVRSHKTVYGVNTGFGKLAEIKVAEDELAQLQLNLVRSHSVGTGEPLSEEESRAVMVVRLNSLLKGNSGVSVPLVRQLERFLNERVYPLIPRHGSLGASGDLAPSAHLALCMIGEGFVIENGERVPSSNFLPAKGIEPIELGPKEGLALINGTQVMTGLASLLIHDAENLLLSLDVVTACTLESLGASLIPFDARVHELRPHEGQIEVASRVRKLVEGSKLMGTSNRVQDAYSLRCVPQVHGPFWEALRHVRKTVETELNSVTDNPILFPESDEVVSSGNFHGHPLAVSLDYLCLVLAEVSVISERRIDKLLSAYHAKLPLFLTESPGLSSGLMVTQYTAASLVSHSRILASPVSFDNAIVSAGQEDHASLGATAALKAREVLENSWKVLAIELLCAVQAIDMLGGEEEYLGSGTRRTYEETRKITKKVESDRSLFEDVEKLEEALKAGVFSEILG